MTRIKGGVTSHAKHKKLLESVKGYRGTKSRLIKVAKEAYLHAGQYAFHGRKLRKRDARSAWILKIGEAAKLENLPYNKLILGLKKANILLDRKILADLISSDCECFKKITEEAKKFAFNASK